MACDDFCYFKISVDDPLDHLAANTLLTIDSYVAYRDKTVDDKSESSPFYGTLFS